MTSPETRPQEQKPGEQVGPQAWQDQLDSGPVEVAYFRAPRETIPIRDSHIAEDMLQAFNTMNSHVMYCLQFECKPLNDFPELLQQVTTIIGKRAVDYPSRQLTVWYELEEQGIIEIFCLDSNATR